MAPSRRKTDNNSRNRRHFVDLASTLCELGKSFYSRGWALGTSGNYSAVTCPEPLRLAITASGLDKSALSPADILEIDKTGKALRGKRRPSYEYLLHLAIVRARRAGAVLHTHSVWATILSEHYSPEGSLAIQGYEMLKGLAGVRTHEHRELVPIVENSQDMAELSKTVETALQNHPAAHGFLLRGHGLYTWGCDVQEAKRHVEIFEFLLEVVGRTHAMSPLSAFDKIKLE
jgi:methylthioribulose-1-phosphate dehydratase